MTDGMAMELARQALVTAVLVAAPVLGLGLLVSLLVSLFQATTQINEQTLTFIPKILAMLAGLLLFGPWMLTVLMDFTRRMMALLPAIMR